MTAGTAPTAVHPGRPVLPAPLLLDGVVPVPAEAAERYRAAGYWTDQTLGSLVRDAATATARPDAVALVDARRTLTYADLDRAADDLAHGFAALGVRRGDRVVVHLPSSVELVEVLVALGRSGVVPVLALPAHRRTEVEYFAAHTEAVVLVTTGAEPGFDHAGLAREVAGAVASVRHVVVAGAGSASPAEAVDPRAVPATPGDRAPFAEHALDDLRRTDLTAARGGFDDAAHPSDVVLLQLSGGTTGTPKLIPRTHADYLYSVRESAAICGLGPGSVYLATLPVAHNYALTSPGVLGVLHAGGTVVLSPHGAPDAAFALIERHRVTHVALVPPLAHVWAASPLVATHDLSSLRVLQVGGAKLGTSAAERLLAVFGDTLQQVFGMAEGLVCYTREGDPRDVVVGTQGRPISPDDEVLVVDDDDLPVGTGEPGHLLTRGPYTIRGYYRAPEHDARSFTADGFYRTGDLVTRDADGYLTVVGRAKEQINRGGEKVAPAEVENHLRAHPDVLDASVVGEPDEYLGERALARVVPRPGAAPPTAVVLRRFLRERGIAAYKIPDRFETVEALATTAVGKVDRTPAPAPAPAGTETRTQPWSTQ
ncbi:(2,3-dihydroxybenzoyl)adenylate synthase [Cellulosimicrobium protaetiae]|uniref:AMP-binding protein n=1 Tax=Cellulosimicrobium protaetiae TaxID=2587808 RepID=A0A6M5UDY5_9MICO|nr:AMP-binding protein [Cellulosimicrobium protaetiae]QJW35852.1 AMP-binding protein [Cellulosimicrobium protaetiae]